MKKMNLTSHHVTSKDGCEIFAVTAGNPNNPPILLIHGTCSSHKIWKHQLTDESLTERYFLIAPDLRGHGQSAKPKKRESYQTSDRWADDIDTLLSYFTIEKCAAVAWSYGGRVINDYLLIYGHQKITCINFIAAGTLSTSAVKGPGYKILAQLFNEQDGLRHEAERQFANDLCAGLKDEDWYAEVLNDIQQTQLKTRLYMRDRVMNYEDMLSELSIPVLLTHGKKDQYSLPLLAELLFKHLQNPTLSWYEAEGHLPFFYSAPRFNKELAEFVHANF